MEAFEVPSIEEILDEFGISDMLYPDSFNQLLDALKNRENIMLTEFKELREHS